MEFMRSLHPIYASVSIILTAIVLYLSLLPGNELPQVNLLQADKIVHFVMYLVLTVAYAGSSRYKYLILAGILAFAFGLIVELLQHFLVSTRFFDVFDILANASGVLFGILLLKKLSLTV